MKIYNKNNEIISNDCEIREQELVNKFINKLSVKIRLYKYFFLQLFFKIENFKIMKAFKAKDTISEENSMSDYLEECDDIFTLNPINN